MAIVLQTQILLDPNNQIAHLVDYTGLTEAIEYVISATFLAADTRFVFQGHFDIALTRPPVGVPQAQTEVPATISTVPTPAAATPPARYPYAINDRLIASNLNLALAFDPAPTPPSGNGGGAGIFKYWVDTSGALPTLRQCTAFPRATPGVYVPGEWLTLGTIDAAQGKFHFNSDHVDFGGGSLGTINVGSINATGNITAVGQINGGAVSSTGANASLSFSDRVTNQSWIWYASSGLARLWANGDRITVDSGGTLSVTGEAHIAGSIVSSYQLYLGGQFIFFMGSTTLPQGNFINFDPTNFYAKLGPGNGAFYFQDYGGTTRTTLGSNGNIVATGNIYGLDIIAYGNFWASGGTVTAAYIHSTGSMLIDSGIQANTVYVAGAVSAGDMYRIRDRDLVSPEWGWYVQSGVARLWDAAYGDRITIDAGGGLSARGFIAAVGNLYSGSNLYLTGQYVLFNGNPGNAQGPYIFSDGTIFVFRSGPGSGGWYFQNNAGNANPVSIDGTGTIYCNTVNTAGNIDCGVNILAHNNIQANGGTHSVAGYSMTDPAGGTTFRIWSDPGYSYIRFAPGWTWQFNLSGDTSNGALVWFCSGNEFMHLRWGNDYMIFNNYGTWAGHGAFVNLSDRRGKKNITPSTRGLAEILKLNPVEFDRISDADIPREVGFTAQDVMSVIPEAVRVAGMKLPDGTGGLDDVEPTLGLMDSAIVAALVNAVKELNTRLIALE